MLFISAVATQMVVMDCAMVPKARAVMLMMDITIKVIAKRHHMLSLRQAHRLRHLLHR
jgi:hypothetical protein